MRLSIWHEVSLHQRQGLRTSYSLRGCGYRYSTCPAQQVFACVFVCRSDHNRPFVLALRLVARVGTPPGTPPPTVAYHILSVPRHRCGLAACTWRGGHGHRFKWVTGVPPMCGCVALDQVVRRFPTCPLRRRRPRLTPPAHPRVERVSSRESARCGNMGCGQSRRVAVQLLAAPQNSPTFPLPKPRRKGSSKFHGGAGLPSTSLTSFPPARSAVPSSDPDFPHNKPVSESWKHMCAAGLRTCSARGHVAVLGTRVCLGGGSSCVGRICLNFRALPPSLVRPLLLDPSPLCPLAVPPSSASTRSKTTMTLRSSWEST